MRTIEADVVYWVRLDGQERLIQTKEKTKDGIWRGRLLIDGGEIKVIEVDFVRKAELEVASRLRSPDELPATR